VHSTARVALIALTLAARAVAQTKTDCGKVPQFKSKLEEQEKVTRELNVQAQILSRLAASVGGTTLKYI